MGTLKDNYRAHLAAWQARDIDLALSYIADDIVWYPNRSMEPIRGKAAMRTFLEKWGRGMSDIRYEQLHMVEAGDVLLVEGTETYSRKGRQVTVPYAGVVVWRDGKAVEWRDYFDMKQLEAQLAG